MTKEKNLGPVPRLELGQLDTSVSHKRQQVSMPMPRSNKFKTMKYVTSVTSAISEKSEEGSN